MKSMKNPNPNFSAKKTLSRLLKYVFRTYPIHVVIITICIILSAIGSIAAAVFMSQFIDNVIYARSDAFFDLNARYNDNLTDNDAFDFMKVNVHDSFDNDDGWF